MDKGKPSLGIYAIPDRNNLPYPEESHDHGLALMDQGKVVKFLQLERKSRNKHDQHLPEYLYDMLKSEGLLPGDYDIAFTNNVLGNSMISNNGKLRLEGPVNKDLSPKPLKSHAYWLDQSRDAWMVNHELAHIFSTLPFYGEFPDNSLLIHFDGGASQSNFSAWVSKRKKIKLIEAHWKFKYLSSFFNANALCFGIIGAKKEEQLAVPGKLMGLASYGSWSPEIEVWLQANNWFSDIWGSKKMFFESAYREFGWNENRLDSKDPFLQNILATFHNIFVRDTLREINKLALDNDLNKLVFSGGSALNIVLNSRIVRSDIFKKVLIPPCTNDSGLALGAAACLEYHKHGKTDIHDPFLENWGNTGNLNVMEEFSQEDIKVAADWIFNGKIIGVCNGQGEAGPRALGNRSLLCRADDRALSKKLSMEFKLREWYRPLAPIMRKEKVGKYTGENNPSSLGRFMLDEFTILKEEINNIIGAVHVDGTARIQFLETREDNPFVWDLLICLENLYNIDCLINTSFNIRGEPLVDSEKDARETAKKMGLRNLIIHGKTIELFL